MSYCFCKAPAVGASGAILGLVSLLNSSLANSITHIRWVQFMACKRTCITSELGVGENTRWSETQH